MKAFLVCVLLTTVAAVSFAHHFELCDKQDEPLKNKLQCIGLHISQGANRRFDRTLKALGCQDRSCVIRKLCVANDLEAAMATYFTKHQITEIHNAATTCNPEAGPHHH
ncbi:antimicrobial peptide microplusin-like isoform X5 [Dermacentor silvarum]|uniref:antimicrobial peptide microplusin-like isoform X4 n=1 Tax=Dermacentor silvarum TaxID=543639 RepID=UPI0021014551|nr:antimicrobial peptide microplusin-like isoform X4 [Dermacentor silvarum]XP_049515952.1 antimicrobial peptide microplusin-like isoform X5 [Dermacentor silvarum]